jgi:hypothetical protein
MSTMNPPEPSNSPSPPPPIPISIDAEYESTIPSHEGHSAYYIEEIQVYLKLFVRFAVWMLWLYAVLWALSTDMPMPMKLGAIAMSLSKTSHVKKLTRKMRRVEMRDNDDLEAGVVKEGGDEDEDEDGDKVEMEKRGRLLTREEGKGEDEK